MNAKKIFLSYKFDDEPFVLRVNYYLKKQPRLKTYCYEDEKGRKRDFQTEIPPIIKESDAIIVFVGQELGQTQVAELKLAYQYHKNKIPQILVNLPQAVTLGSDCGFFMQTYEFFVKTLEEANALKCAKKITEELGEIFIPDDDLPIDYPFDYEKDIIQAYIEGEISKEATDARLPSNLV